MKKLFNRKKSFIIVLILIISLSSLIVLNITRSIVLENGSRVEQNTDLTYYLNVTYDGVDRLGIESSNTTRADIKSGYIYVEDKIPNGLIFNGFVESPSNTIGSAPRDKNSTETCYGYVINDSKNEESLTNYHGLHYDEKTRIVSFKVKNLQAGCELNVGIKTITPEVTNKERIDFYNYATAREKNITKNSNIVHAWIGEETSNLYTVTYEYIGDVPSISPPLPQQTSYKENTLVNIALLPTLSGYKFSGWSIDNIDITNGTFTMPAKNITVIGSFQASTPYTVTYSIEGELPPDYIPPKDQEYYEYDLVNIDILSKDDIFNGYRFKGWTAEGIDTDEDGNFIMPDHDVNLIGTFEEIKYKVEYKFYNSNLPANASELLPATNEYKAGSTVTLEKINDVTGYHFLGWNKDDNFIMPEEDIVIYGEWQYIRGYFEPSIKIEVIDAKDYYKNGDIVKYKVTVTNNASYPIKEVTLIENNERAKFLNNTGYIVNMDRIATIETIASGSSVEVLAEYEVNNSDKVTVINEVEILSATADNYYNLNTDKNYKASVGFKVYSILSVCNVIDKVTNDTYHYHIENSNGYDTWLNVKANDCSKIYLKDGEYEITELVPQDNIIDKKQETVNISGDINITFTNTYKKKGFYKSNGEVYNLVESKILYEKIKNDAITGLNSTRILLPEVSKVDKDIYYFTNANYNNVLFANFCWKVVRTTETEGVKLLYNGVSKNGVCNNTAENSQIGTSMWNPAVVSLSYAGYMYNNVYEIKTRNRGDNGNIVYGKSFTYSGGKYTLVNTVQSSNGYISNSGGVARYYTCLTTASTCSTLYYIPYWYNERQTYVALPSGKTSEETRDLMLYSKEPGTYVNKKNSTIKTKVDNWYKSNMTKYTDMLEDAVWCNERGSYDLNSNNWNSTASRTTAFHFFGYSTSDDRLSCTNNLDKFTVSKSNGNGDLIYPVGLVTSYEGRIFGSSIKSGVDFWTMSPGRLWDWYDNNSPVTLQIQSINKNGGVSTTSLYNSTEYGVRPSISLKAKTPYSKGDGTVNNPYVIEID